MNIELYQNGKTTNKVELGENIPVPSWRDDIGSTESDHVFQPRYLQGTSIFCTLPHEIEHAQARLNTIFDKLENAAAIAADFQPVETIREDLQVKAFQDVRGVGVEVVRDLRNLADWIDGKNPTGTRTQRFTRTMNLSQFPVTS